MIVLVLPFGPRRIDSGMVIEYLRPARRRNLFCDAHEGSFSKEPTFAFKRRSNYDAPEEMLVSINFDRILDKVVAGKGS